MLRGDVGATDCCAGSSPRRLVRLARTRPDRAATPAASRYAQRFAHACTNERLFAALRRFWHTPPRRSRESHVRLGADHVEPCQELSPSRSRTHRSARCRASSARPGNASKHPGGSSLTHGEADGCDAVRCWMSGTRQAGQAAPRRPAVVRAPHGRLSRPVASTPCLSSVQRWSTSVRALERNGFVT